jgi:hypothetical protein
VVVIALAFALSSPAAGAVSAWSRAAMDVLTMLRSAFTDNPTRSGDYSSCEPRRP